ncbi:hypothetical protein GOV12_04705, partial [Candidatus Pacearchaeota archaeon]|nr:hypothetical protein [Candidatus Pacearchaeota archaeon]
MMRIRGWNKKSMMKVGAGSLILVVFTIIFIFIIIPILSSSPLEKTSYNLGEKVRINLRNYGSYSLKIITPSTTHEKKGINNVIMYTLDEIGNYSIIVREGKNIEEYNFSVIGLINDDSDEDIFDEDLVIEEIFNESNIRVGKPVKWVKKTNIAKGTRRTKVDIPTNSLNVSLYKNSVRGRNIVEESKSKVVNSTTNNDKKSVIITDLDGDIEVEYYTKAPNKEEKIISGNKKEVLVYSSENYSDVIAYTDVMEVTNNKKYIKVFWKEENKNIDFEAKDLDFDGLIDNIEWVVPHLSNQTFEIIVITKAEHLNSSRGFISDIYDKVKEKDDDWSEEINDGEYVRVTFENNLTSSNDITIFPRIVSGDPKVFVYEVDGVEILAEFNEIVENSYNKVFLNNLGGTQDSFDLLILNGTIEFDHIIDPVSQPSGEVELRVQECKEQGQEASQNNFPTFCEDGSYPNACGSGSDHMSCNDIYNEFADTDRSGAIYRWGGIRIETYNSTILDCDSIDEVFLCYEFWGASAKHDCFVGVNSDGDWNDTAVTCEASAPGVTCIDVTSEENWDCLDFFGSGDGTRAQAKSQAHMISGSGSQTWSFDVLFFNVSYTAADITPPVVTIDSPTNGNSYGVSDLPLYFNVTLNENGSCLYSLDSGNTNLTMTTSGGSLYGLVFNATNLSIDDGNYTFKALCNDTAGKRNDSQSADFSYDETAPSMSYTVPSESTGVYRNRNYILVNVSANDSLTGLNNITIRFYNTSDNLLYINITGESPFYVNYSNLLDGVYYYNSSSNDSVGNIQNLETRNITLDTTYPKILYEPQTNPNGKSIRGNSIYVNVTVNETNEVNITYLLYNITGQVFKNTFTNGQRDVNWTPLIDGNYSYNVTIVDIVDLVNATETRLVILDNVKPLLIVNDPSFNGVNLSGTSVLFNITLNEYGGDVYYSLDNGGTNNSMSSSDNLTYTATNSSIDDLQYTVNFYLNDSAGNRNDSVSQKFGIDNVIPGIVITNPTPINYTIDQIDINFSTSDDNSGIDSCWYSVDFGNTNTSIDNCLNTSITSPQGSVVLIVYTNDTAGNINFTENVSFYVDSVYPDIEYDSNTRPNASSFENPWIYVNVTVVENNFSNITYMLFNETSGGTEVNITTYTSLDLDINWTGLNNDNIDYYYNVTVVDTLGNTNYTQTRTLTLTPGDVQGPVIIFISPVSQGAYINESSILFNISLDENGSYVYYSLDNGGINFSMSTIDNIYYDATNSSISDGIYTLDIFTNDTIGNPSNKSRNFTIDTVIPLIEYVSSDYDLVYDEDIWNYSGSPTNPSSSIDNDFLTFARVDSTGGVDILYFNYSIPIDLQTVKLEYLADWEIFDGTFECYNSTSSWDNFASTADNVRTNVSIPSQCYQGGIMQLRLYRSLTPGEAGWVNFYEQQVFWNISPVTPGDNSNLSSDFIYINVKADEINEANITFLLHNSTGEVNTTTYISVVRAINITNLPDGNYTYNVTIFDLATSFNTTNTYTITLDTNNPSANLSIPANNTITNETNYNLTVNISDNIEIDNITLYIYNSSDSVINETNFNLSDAQMFFGVIYVFADGIFEWFYRIIDIAGNYVYTQNYTITVDSTYPDIEFGTGTNASGTEDEREWIYVNVSFTEDNFVNVTYTLYNDTSGATQINKTTFDSQVYTINWTNLSSLNVTYFYNVTIVDLTSNRNSTSTNTLKLIDITNPGIILSDPDNQTYDYNTSIPISIIVNDTHLDSCKYTLNNGVTNTSIPDCRSSSFSVADNQSYMLIVYVNDSLGQSNSTNISFFVDTTSIETLDYQVQRGQIAIDGKKSITIEKSDPRKSFSLIDIRSENHTSDSLYYTVTPSSNYTALTFENYDKTSTVSWEYITGPGISAERGEVAYNESDTGFEVTITEIDITESFIIINNRLDSAANDAYSQGLWSARFFNDSTIIINRSQSSSAGNVSWQIVELNGASIQRGNSRIIGIFNSSVLTSAVNLSRSVLFMSSRVSDAGQIIEDSNSSLSTIIFGSVSSGSLSDTYESDGTAYDILATPGYLLNTTFIFNTNSPSGVNNFNISVRWNQVGTAGAPTTTAQIYNFFNNSWESLSNIVISAKVYEDDTQTITNNVLNYVNSSGSILVMFQHDHSSTAKRYNILFDYIDVDFNVTTAANAASTFIGGRFENETLLSFYREDSEGTVDIEWHIVEWDRFKVDRNNLDVTGTDSVYNSTSKLINRSKSFRSTFFSSSGSENYNADSMLSSFIFNTTDIEFKKGTSSETQNVSWQVIEIVERNNPVVDLKSPLNSSQLDSSVIIGFNFSVNDSSQMDNCSLYGDWSSGWHLNQTIISPEKVSELNFSSIDVVNDGTYLWNVLCYDLYGNLAFNNTNYSFTVDSTYPWIEYNLQTISNNSNLSQNWIYVNVTVNESNEANITYLLHNSSGQIFKNTFTTPQRLINWTPLINQYYTFNVTVTDTFNNKNTTGNRFVILDTTFPGIKINTPLNNTNTSTSLQNLTVNLTDNFEFDNATLFVINSSDSIINQTIWNLSGNVYYLGINYNFSYDGSFKWFYKVSDIAGNLNESNNFTITIDSTIPLIDYGVGTLANNSNVSQSFIYVNVTVNETNEVNITFKLHNSSGEVNETIYPDENRDINWTTLPDGNYTFNVTIVDLVLNSNSTGTYFITLDTTEPSGNLSVPLNLSYTDSTSQNLTVNVSDNIELDNATLFVINSSDSIINTTVYNMSGPEYFLGIVYEFLYDGVFQWFYRIFD